MKLNFYNCPEPLSLNTASLGERPAFLSYIPDFENMAGLAEKYQDYKNIIIIGHGGSMTSFYGIYHALQEQSSKQAYFVSTIDPDYIAELKSFLMPIDTLVVAISKSGETVTQIEALMQFQDFPLLVITGSMGPLYEVAEKFSAQLVLHPPIGGRFSGLTEVGLLPAALCGLDVRQIYKAGAKWYAEFGSSNAASNVASVFFQLEANGIADVFIPVYDSHLFAMTNLFVQLCHESFGKNGKGQTYFAHEAPESQHHTNQRFFGGQKNIAGWFLSSETHTSNLITQVPENLKSVTIKNKTLGALSGLPLHLALQAELQGTLEDAQVKNIPAVSQTVTERSPAEIGELIGFWQLFAIYSSVLREVNPYDQPQVESSKEISFAKRLQHGGLL
jgi:glucose-6-phosphate isomerase